MSVKSSVTFLVLDCGSYATGGSLAAISSFSSSISLFNVPEGLHRKIPKPKKCFYWNVGRIAVTSGTWKHAAGLKALLRTKNAYFSGNLDIYGPPALNTLLTIQDNDHFRCSQSQIDCHDQDLRICDRILSQTYSLPKAVLYKSHNNLSLNYPDCPQLLMSKSVRPATEYFSYIFSDIASDICYLMWEASGADSFPRNIPDNLRAVFHFTSKGLMDAQLKLFRARCHKKVEHVMMNDLNFGGKINFNSPISNYYGILKELNPEVFPGFHSDAFRQSRKIEDFIQTHDGQTLDFNHNINKYSNEVVDTKEHKIMKDGGKYPVITFLGTSSRRASTFRNQSSILVRLNPDSFILLDAGEGTYEQLVNRFGYDNSRNILKKLKVIYLSHLHSDHSGGLVTLLSKRRDAADTKLYLIAPRAVEHFLRKYHNLYEDVIDSTYHIRCDRCFYGDKRLYPHIFNRLYRDVGLKSLGTCFAWHGNNAFVLSLITVENVQLIYSGDGFTKKGVVDLALDARRDAQSPNDYVDLLIHEATFPSYLREVSKLTYHTSVEGAIQIGRSINARSVILTHFMARHEKLPNIEDIEDENVGVAFDFMTVNHDFKVGGLLKDFEAVFEEEYGRNIETKIREMEHMSQYNVIKLQDAGIDE